MIETTTELNTDHFKSGKELSDLSLIQNDDINITIYEREISKDIEAYLTTLLSKGFNRLNTTINVQDFEALFDHHFSAHRLKHEVGHTLLKEDIKRLLSQFSKICNNPNMKIFFGIVDTDMCRRFHVDMYELRMLCTYLGRGTHWLSNDNINYNSLNNYESNEGIVLREKDVNQLKATDVAIIKGALYPNSKVGGLVHRSPTIEHLNQKRIVLRVDTNSLLDSIN